MDDIFVRILCSIVSLVAVLILGAFVYLTAAALTMEPVGPIESVKRDAELVTFSTDEAIDGDGNGRGRFCVTEKDYYRVYQKNDDGSYSLKRYPADKTKVFEDDDVKPHVVTIQVCHKNQYFGGRKVDPGLFMDSERYELYVPKGTVVREFKAD